MCLKSGSEVIVLLTINDRLVSYASVGLQPLLATENGRALIVKCLVEKVNQGMMAGVAQPFGKFFSFSFEKILNFS